MVAKIRVAVLGAGYAGLAAALELARSARFEIHLLDRKDCFLRVTRLHQTVHSSLEKLQIRYQDLAERYGFRFHRLEPDFDVAVLADWQAHRTMTAAATAIPFDYLIVATGARAVPLEKDSPPELLGRRLFDLERLKSGGVRAPLQDLLARSPPKGRALSVVGGGANGVQFLFELDDHLRLHRQVCRLNLVNQEERLLTPLPRAFHRHVQDKIMARRGTIGYYPHTRFLAQTGDRIELEDTHSGERFDLPSQLTLLFPGMIPQPALRANRFGQLYHGDRLLPLVFGAGDCTAFDGAGLNALSAQAAVRKGKAVAANVRRHAEGDPLHPYDYREIGYFVSLGTWDGAGWLLAKNAVVTGLPAFAIKEAVEAQFALFLEGYDTYINV